MGVQENKWKKVQCQVDIKYYKFNSTHKSNWFWSHFKNQ